MFTTVALVLLVSSPPAEDSNSEIAEQIAAAIKTSFEEQGIPKRNIEIEVHNDRNVVLSGKVGSIDELKVLLDTVSPHATTLTVNVTAGPKSAKAPDWPSRGLKPGWPSYDLDWIDASWRQLSPPKQAHSPGAPQRN